MSCYSDMIGRAVIMSESDHHVLTSCTIGYVGMFHNMAMVIGLIYSSFLEQEYRYGIKSSYLKQHLSTSPLLAASKIMAVS